MQTAGARILREDDHELSREAVLLAWERKIEQEERLSSARRLERREQRRQRVVDGEARPTRTQPAANPTRPRFESSARRRPAPAKTRPRPAVERHAVTRTVRAVPERRRRSIAERHITAQPDRIALWAFLLGLFLIAVAAATAHAAPL